MMPFPCSKDVEGLDLGVLVTLLSITEMIIGTFVVLVSVLLSACVVLQVLLVVMLGPVSMKLYARVDV